MPTEVVLFDTWLPFGDAASWSKFPLKGVTGDEFYYGCGSDGRYVYFVPRTNANGVSDGLVARYDTTEPLSNTNSWRTFQTTQLPAPEGPFAKGFDHASWDGRYFYFMTGSDTMLGTKNVIVRYDTTENFTSKASWSTFDMRPLLPPTPEPPRAWGGGVVFDGEYVYIAAEAPPVVVRFHARSPAKMPPGFSGSFY